MYIIEIAINFSPASAQSIGGLSSLKTSEVTLDTTKRLVGFTILIELSLGPSAILPLALIEGLRPDALRESLFVGFSSVDMVLLLMRSIGSQHRISWTKSTLLITPSASASACFAKISFRFFLVEMSFGYRLKERYFPQLTPLPKPAEQAG